MFKTSVTTTPFTTEMADNSFSNITGESFGSDVSFLATLRALFAPRIPDGESIHLRFGRSNYTAAQVSDNSVDTIVRALMDNVDCNENGLLYIHNLAAATSEDNVANIRCLEAKMTEIYPQFVRLEEITAFFRKSFNVICFVCPEKKITLIFVDKLNNSKLHYLQCPILGMLPWYFDKGAGVTETEMELIKSLREPDSDHYLRLLNDLVKHYDFRAASIRNLLAGFETKYEQIELEAVKSSIQEYNRSLAALNERFGDTLRAKDEALVRFAGLERRIQEGGGESEIMDYFLCNSRLYLESVTDDEMYFAVKDYITYFDKDLAESVIANRRSCVYSYLDREYNKDKVEKLMREIFLADTPRLRIKTCAAYSFNLRGSVRASGGHTFGAEFLDSIPNTHIQRYTCLGTYQPAINTLLMDRNYIGAIEQCIASCKSLNWGDGTVLQSFMETFFRGSNGNNCCVELPDGRVVKPREAIQWLDAQDALSNG